MNKPIRTISIFCLVLFMALLANVTYLQFFQAKALDENPLNRRVIEAAYGRERGAILVGRDPVALSKPSNDNFAYQRYYPKPQMYAPVTGFFSYYSQTGVEKSQNSVLSGDDPQFFVSRLTDMLSNAEPKGGSIQLTINPKAQQAAYDGLKALGPDVQGAVVALEPATGKVLAMVSLPSYDPNALASHDFGAVTKADNALLKDGGQPLVNRAISMRLPPGSTFKILTAAAAIESGKYTASSMVPGGATYKLPDSTKVIDNQGRNCGTGKIPFALALENSCNTSFLALADQVGASEMHKVAEGFGFNEQGFTDLPAAATSAYPGGMNRPDTALSGIGQSSVAATPLQMAMVTAGIANNGVVMRPYLINSIINPNLGVTPGTGQAEMPNQPAVSSSTASEVTKLMVSTVDVGTATPAQIPGVKVAGKTGTAESGLASHPAPYAWFVSFAPDVNAKVAVAVMIQNINKPTDEIHGGTLGGPIAKAVMEAVLNP